MSRRAYACARWIDNPDMTYFVTFTPNPALDLSTSVERLVEAHKLRCGAVLRHPGGGGINVARVLHRLGAEVRALYPAGGPTGERLHQLLSEEGVPDQPWTIEDETRENFTVHERSTGREYRFVLPGPMLGPHDWQAGLLHLQQCTPMPRWIISSGSLPPGVDTDGHAQVARLARKMGARMVVDSSGEALSSALTQGVWLFKPSLRELQELSAAALPTPALQKEAARLLIAAGKTHMVALSLGSEGAMLVTADQCLHARALPAKAEGSVGAGDSFLAGLLWALDAGTGLKEALATAVAAGTAAVMATGTTLSQREEVMYLRQKVQVRAV